MFTSSRQEVNNSMASPIISFRFTDLQVESLEALRQHDESISQCAARLLREALGLSLQGVDIGKQVVKDELEAIVDKRLDYIVNELTELRAKVEKLEKATPSDTKPRRTSSRQKSTEATSEASK